jgi:two-component system chemotaxis sensor kinase CheA
MEDKELIQEFLIESSENLARLDQEMVELERQPKNPELLASIFRTVHTIKGTCGFLAFSRLEAVAHVAENILSELRGGKRDLDTPLTSLILESVDAIKRILASIEAGSGEGERFEDDLLRRLRQVLEVEPIAATPMAAAPNAAAVTEESASTPGGGEAPPAARTHSAADTTLRVDVGLLDRLMNLVGELVLTRNQVLQYNAARDDASLSAISQRLNLITTELQEGVMKTRMQPIGLVWSKLPRMVRDLATSLGKDIALEMDGAETELDRTIIEAIKDPLTHIVRNSCDHGIETAAARQQTGKPARGRLALRAFHEGGQVNIEISDDGAGIHPGRVRDKALERGLLSADQAKRLSDRDAINLVFLPGFSTAKAVTSVSGRGVGMDVVRTNIEQIGGTVEIVSQAGQGTKVRVKIPLTLAIVPGLVVGAGGERFVIPQASLHELIRLEGEASHTKIEFVHSTPVYRRRDTLLPLADLTQVLGLVPQRPADEVSIVVLQADGQRFGLIVDSISDTQEIVVKPLGQQLKGVSIYAGATIMGDGRIALILDVPGIGLRSGVLTASGDVATAGASLPEPAGTQAERISLLMFRAGGFTRLAMPLSKVARLEKIPRAQVERAAGHDVLQYRGAMLPLISLADALGGQSGPGTEFLPVIVYRDGEGAVGLVVEEILDIVEEQVLSARGADHPGLLASAVVAGRVTDFIDLEAMGTHLARFDSGQSLARLDAALGLRQPVEIPEEVTA